MRKQVFTVSNGVRVKISIILLREFCLVHTRLTHEEDTPIII